MLFMYNNLYFLIGNTFYEFYFNTSHKIIFFTTSRKSFKFNDLYFLVNINYLNFFLQNEKKVDVEAEDDPELARYLNRSYWESLKMGNIAKSMQTKMASTNVYFSYFIILNYV